MINAADTYQETDTWNVTGREKMHQGLLPGPQQATMCPLLVQCIYPVLKSLGFPLLFYSSLLNQQDLTL